MTVRTILALAIVPLALAGCNRGKPEERPAVSPAARVVGAAQACVPLMQVRETRVRDDWTIDFIRDGKRAWRNTLPSRCSGLKMNDGFSYKTSLSELCSTDIIHVLERMGGDLRQGASCGLGQFVPVELEK